VRQVYECVLESTSKSQQIQNGELAPSCCESCLEEVGLKGLTTRFLYKYVWESQREKELVFSFITVTDNKPVIDRVEIDEGKFWAIDEIRNNIGKYIFTPNFEHEFGKLERELSNLTPESFKSRNKGRV